MATRKGERYRVTWSPSAKHKALELATPLVLPSGRVCPAMSYRTIAADLVERGLVDRKVDAASVRRVVLAMRKEARAVG